MLKKKMFRDIKQNLSQFITIFLMVLIGVMVYVGIEAYMDGMTSAADIFYKNNNIQDLNVMGNLSDKDLDKIKSLDNVKAVEKKLVVNAIDKDNKDKTYLLSFIDSNNISKFHIMDGEKFDVNKKGVWVDNFYAEKNNLNLSQTKVGDRYVLEEMLKNGYNLGGEQSGHIILLDYNPTGDGILTSLMLIQILLEKNVLASELCDIIQIYPQVLINAKVNSEKKSQYLEDKEIQTKIKEIENEFANEGRVVIRPSGTEPLIRVMIEGKDKNYIAKKAEEIAKLIEEKLN
mgnify:CR=1 FL=1